ncbi:ParB/RepB/Spo0J family partition protein [Streptomyces sp. NPDC102365]|uniref:ParB/RepB/Spo0J family partition protein n=1 Tax=Streptomyces sp. NPDC102365 TaxID=3366162 RepID=UPI0037F59199
MLAATPNRLPPITVHRPMMRVIDGYHRSRAARLRGASRIAARFVDGDERAAFVLSVRLDVTHGLPVALADRKRAAERIIVSHPQWSDRRVASVNGIAPGTAGDIRKRVVRGPEGRRLGRDGRMRPVDGSSPAASAPVSCLPRTRTSRCGRSPGRRASPRRPPGTYAIR